MTREDVIQMARKAGSLIEIAQEKDLLWLTAFAKLVAQHERDNTLEEVAKEFDAMRIAFGDTADSFATYVRDMKIEK
jgi:phytoene/squalene synthetase